MTETIRISYEEFKEMVEESRKNGIQKRMLSLEEKSRPKIAFQSRRNLKAVAETKALRKKLGKFMGEHFLRWKGSRQITLNRTAFSSRNRRPMGPECAGELSSTIGRT